MTPEDSGWLRDAEELKRSPPKHLLFLCVANSARSQMAEGIARKLAPLEMKISSAGSRPGKLHPVAVEALHEIGIDISRQYSKGLDQIDLDTVDTVITLCAEEVCPVFPRKVRKFHWGLADPAAVAADREAKLASFRSVRDELVRRLSKSLTAVVM